MRDRTISFLALAALTACADPPPPPARAGEVIDSAGVEIFTSSFDGSVAPPTSLVGEPLARTGWDQDGPLLGFVTYGRLLQNRSAVVADLDTDEILVLDSDLRLSATFGGNGQGPGEFGGIGGVAEMAPDSIVVWDGSQARATIFDVENLGFRTAGYNPAGGVEHTVAATSGRDLLWVPRAPYARQVETSQWLRIPVLRSDAAIERIDTVVSLPFAEVVISGGSGGRPTTRPIPRTADFDAGPGGFAWLRMDVPELRFLDPVSGRLDRVVRWTEEPVPVTDSRWAEWVDGRMAQFEDAPGPTPPLDGMRQALDEQRALAAPTFPLFARFELASDGSTWIHRWRMPGSERSRYLVVSEDGRCLMNIEAPDRFFFMDSRDGVVLGRAVNELGVHAIALYERPECPTV